MDKTQERIEQYMKENKLELAGHVHVNVGTVLIVDPSEVLNDVKAPAGLNIGMNLGRAAGAGVLGHLHVHLVPRWVGDTNFMPAIFETRIISVDLKVIHRKLKAAFAKRAKS